MFEDYVRSRVTDLKAPAAKLALVAQYVREKRLRTGM